MNGLTLEAIEGHLWRRDNVTEYERANGIYTDKVELSFSGDGIRFYKVHKTDGSSTLTIVYQAGINSRYWFYWVISKSQAIAMSEVFPGLYKAVDEFNKEVKSI